MKRKPLDSDKLLRVLESYADGEFDTLVDVEWYDAEDFFGAACYYVDPDDRKVFKEALFASMGVKT